MDYGTSGEEEFNKQGIFCGWILTQCGDTDGAIIARDIECVLDGDGKAVEGSDRSAGALKVVVELPGASKGGLKEWFGETRGQLMAYGCSLQ